MPTPVLNESNLARIPAGRNALALRSLHVGNWQVSEKIYRPEAVLPLHVHEVGNVTFLLAGALEESAEGRKETCRAMSSVRKPAGTVHANRIGRRGAHVLEVVLHGPGHPPVWRYGWRHHDRDAAQWLALYRDLQRGDDDAIASMEEILPELLCSHEPSPKGGPAVAPTRSRRTASSPWLTEVIQRLQAEDEAASTHAIAARVGLHPVYVARAFRRATGRTIGQYRRRLRVERAAVLLGRARRPIAEIAAVVGFADQAHLTRVFKAEMGLTPAAYRALMRSRFEEPGRLPSLQYATYPKVT